MLYRPSKELMWDTWIFYDRGIFHLFYIRISPGGSRWDGISKAVSRDLIHWEEVGPVLEMSRQAIWLGTGSVVRRGDHYLMNFSEERPAGTQRVCFAQSKDLAKWMRLGDEFDLVPDGVHYLNDLCRSGENLPRWDSLDIVMQTETETPDAPHFHGFLTACAAGASPGADGTLGYLVSDDCVRWSEQPAPVKTGLFPNYEVPCHYQPHRTHYVLFSTNSQASVRFDPRRNVRSGGTYYVVADDIGGPYRLPEGDPLLMGHRGNLNLFSTYVGRVLRMPEVDLFYHHWSSYEHAACAWSGPPLRIAEESPGRLQLSYWEGCEALKSQVLRGCPGEAELVVTSFGARVTQWHVSDGSVSVSGAGAQIALWRRAENGESESTSSTDLRDGRVLEVTLRCQSGSAAGIAVAHEKGRGYTGIICNFREHTVEFGDLFPTHASSLDLQVSDTTAAPIIEYGRDLRLRLLFRKEFFQLFIDDLFVQAFVQKERLNPHLVGFYGERCKAVFRDLGLWVMG